MRTHLKTSRVAFWSLTLAFGVGVGVGVDSHAEEWYELRRENRPVTITATGEIMSSDMVQIGAPPSRTWQMTIAQIATEGHRVQAGDLLVRFETSMQDNRLRQFTGDLTVKKGELAALIETQAQEVETERLELAELESLAEKARQKANYPADLIPSVEYGKLVERREIAKVVYERALLRQPLSLRAREARRKQLEAEIKTLESQLAIVNREMEAFTIYAPRAGLVTLGEDWNGEKFDVNENVHPGHVVVYLVDDSKLEVLATLPEHLASNVEVGQLADLIVDSNTGATTQGRVIKVGSTVRRKSRRSDALVRDFTVEILDQSLEELKVGKAVQITLHVDHIEDAIAVPRSALVYRRGDPGVISDDGWVPVVLGARSEDKYIINSGLDNVSNVRL